ncbi:MAG: tail fiber domain-containing protein [Williamsia sp.]|nr:tail fiber domain-containing protein [Williamsia sp.]
MKQNKDKLKTFFVTNSIPTQGNFYDLIESGLNQNDDGIAKLDSGPIALQSQGAQNEVLHLYKTKIDPAQAADWKIKLSAATPADLGIYNTASNSDVSRLFIRADGNVGIGTISPSAKLEVIGAVKATSFSGDGSGLTGIANVVNLTSDQSIAGVKTFTSNLVATGNVGLGTSTPSARLDVNGMLKATVIQPSLGSTRDNGILFPGDPAGGGGDAAWMRYYARKDASGNTIVDNTVLEIGTSNDADDHIALMPSGNVGIGTTAPLAKLDVAGYGSFNYGPYAYLAFDKNAYDAQLAQAQANLNQAQAALAQAQANQAQVQSQFDNASGMLKPQLAASLANAKTATAVATAAVSEATNVVNATPRAAVTAAVRTGGFVGDRIPISIRASDRIVATEFDASSDARIKKGFTASDPAANLEKLNQLAVTDFCYKDEIQCGDAVQTGFIAQEVEKVMPEAVSTHADFIPDLYTLASSIAVHETVLTVSMHENHGLQSGDIVRLIVSTGAKEVAILKLDDKTFEVHGWKEKADKVFVYGKKVDDFRTVNYNAIFSLGISAIQELYKQIQQLKDDLSALKQTALRKLAIS